jgi:hypothetical protein
LYAIIGRYQTNHPEKIEEIGRRLTEGVVPIVRQVPGFIAYYVTDVGYGVLAAVTICEDQASGDESSRQTAEWIKQHLAALLPNPPSRMAGNVIAAETR